MSLLTRQRMGATLLALQLLLGIPALAENVEDEPIADEAPPGTPTAGTAATGTAATGTPTTLTSAQLEELLRRQERLEQELADLRRILGGVSVATPAPTEEPATPDATEPPPIETDVEPDTGTNRSLLLPDISLIVTGKGKYSDDERDEDRNSFFTDEAELGIQGYVYPNVKADAYIVGAPGEDEAFQVEEGYLTFLGLRKNLNLVAGRKFAPFGRTGEQHPHSWQYSRQLLPRQNLVAGENLTGDGLLLRYLLPTGKLYANLDLGIWNAAGHGHGEEEHDHEGEEGHEGHEGHEGEEGEETPFDTIQRGPGANFEDRFYTARLWLGYPLGRNGELELGASYAGGRSSEAHEDHFHHGRVALSGVDLSYRRFMGGDKRLLLRSEYFRYKPGGDLSTQSASGHYLLANYRFNKRNDLGLLYERSEFPQLPDERESAMSLIYTRQFSEQFYFRLHGTRGDRPGGDYNEVLAQLTWGIGPHTHNLE